MGTLRVTMCLRMSLVKMLEPLIKSGRTWLGNSVLVTVTIGLHMAKMTHNLVALVVSRTIELRLSELMMVDEDTI